MFAVVLVAMVLATFVNPNGPHLHLSILEHLDMRTIHYFDEFRSPNFQSGHRPVLVFEGLILLTVVLFTRIRRRLPWIEVALLAYFLHQGLQSIRHMNLFAIVAVPILAREITPLFEAAAPAFHARTMRMAREQTALRGGLVWFPLFGLVLMVLAARGVLPFPKTLDGIRLTRGATAFIEQHFDRFARPFNTDDLGGALIYHFWPRLKVFVDDRVPVYGDDFTFEDYFSVFFARKNWAEVLKKYDVTAAIVTSSAACATVFRASPDWELAFEDAETLILFPRAAGYERTSATTPK